MVDSIDTHSIGIFGGFTGKNSRNGFENLDFQQDVSLDTSFFELDEDPAFQNTLNSCMANQGQEDWHLGIY